MKGLSKLHLIKLLSSSSRLTEPSHTIYPKQSKAFLNPKAIITAPIHCGPNPQVTNEKLNVSAMKDNEFPEKIVRGIRNSCRLSSMIKRKVFCASERIENCSSRGFTDASLISQQIENASTINPLNKHVIKLDRIERVLNEKLLNRLTKNIRSGYLKMPMSMLSVPLSISPSPHDFSISTWLIPHFEIISSTAVKFWFVSFEFNIGKPLPITSVEITLPIIEFP